MTKEKLEKLLTCDKGVFVWEGGYDTKAIPKRAGFWWHGGNCHNNCKACRADVGKVWWTPHPEKAALLKDYADEKAEAALKEYIEKIEESKATDNQEINIPAPEKLEYLPYQKAGIGYASKRPATLIADEMGLGKTIQALGYINLKEDIKKVLIICPATLRLNWQREAEKWLTRKFSISVIDGKNDDFNADIVIVNYDRLDKNGEKFTSQKWDLLIVDEAHMLKNPKAKRTKKALGYWDKKKKEKIEGIKDHAKFCLFLTGTPILNKPVELQTLLAAIDPRLFGNFMSYAKRYCAAHQTRYGWDFSGSSHLDELQEKLRANVMVRRLKKDVLTELPPKRRQVIVIPPNGASVVVAAEKEAYEAHREKIERLEDEKSLAHATGDETEYNKIVDQLQNEIRLAFTQIAKARHEVALAKIPAVITHLEEMLENDINKIVVFAHHRDVINSLKNHFGDISVTLTGESKNDEKQNAVDKFQNDPSCKIFIGSIKAAGVGITLTASSHVVFAELDWTPAWITQAEDRTHRIGQTNSVLIQHLVLDGSLDADISQKLVEKQNISDKALDLNTEIKISITPTTKKSHFPKKYPVASEIQRKAATAGLQYLASVCDGAIALDGHGFSGLDTRIGKSLASKSLTRDLTDGEVWLACKILPKYHGQLGEELVTQLKDK